MRQKTFGQALWLALALACAQAGAAQAGSAADPCTPSGIAGHDADRDTWSLLVENDVFFNTDRDYTNGVLASVTLGSERTPDALCNAVHMLPPFKNRDLHLSLELGQNIYTPTDLTQANPPLSQRPYAGFLYLGLGVIADDDVALDQLQIQLGIIGPDSLAERVQTSFHGAFGFQKPMGWETQLSDEPALELTYEHSWKLWRPRHGSGLSFDAMPHAGAAAGNVYDYVNAGGEIRAGFNLPEDFGAVRIDPSLPGSSYFGTPGGGARWTLYAFGGADGRVMGRNIFLDGNSFRHSRSVSKNVLVGDLQAGVVFAIGRYKISFTHVFRTKEYHTQPGVDQFGAINFSVQL